MEAGALLDAHGGDVGLLPGTFDASTTDHELVLLLRATDADEEGVKGRDELALGALAEPREVGVELDLREGTPQHG